MRRVLALIADVWGDICVALAERHDAASKDRRERQALEWADRGHGLTEQMFETAAVASEWAWLSGRWGHGTEPMGHEQWNEVRARHLAMKRRWVEVATEGKKEHAAVLDLHVRALEKILADHAGEPLEARDIDGHHDQSEREAKRARAALSRHGDKGIDLARALIADAAEQVDHPEGTRMSAEAKSALARDLLREGHNERTSESLQWLDPQYAWQVEWAVTNARAERERYIDAEPVPVG